MIFNFGHSSSASNGLKGVLSDMGTEVLQPSYRNKTSYACTLARPLCVILLIRVRLGFKFLLNFEC